ncbi:MAG: type II toxin-antitoxin system prevent-host-death family antitoxin [Clostridia bacterium]|nr:type II toxin-antitoxin system prevent-host-death family antitoxin [Clostridia bacterium]
MSITSTELKMNLSKYLVLSEQEDIFITKNGRVIAKISNPYRDRVEDIKTLFGIIPSDADCEKELEERRNNI